MEQYVYENNAIWVQNDDNEEKNNQDDPSYQTNVIHKYGMQGMVLSNKFYHVGYSYQKNEAYQV